jgi:hypothetical protein
VEKIPQKRSCTRFPSSALRFCFCHSKRQFKSVNRNHFKGKIDWWICFSLCRDLLLFKTDKAKIAKLFAKHMKVGHVTSLILFCVGVP